MERALGDGLESELVSSRLESEPGMGAELDAVSAPFEVEAVTAPTESEQRWLLQYSMRSILLRLMLTSSLGTAALVLGPDVYSGCAATQDIGMVVIVLVAMPLLMLIVNHGCHRAAMSPRNSKLVLSPLLLAYYLLIALFDSSHHIMEGISTPSCVAAPSCAVIETAPHHSTDSMMLVDVACNFFVCACLLETWRTRALHGLCHVALWAWDCTNYPKYVSHGTTAQRVWLWAGFLAVEIQMMVTIIAIAIGIDTLWASQRAQAGLEVRLVQMANEKERLAWEAKLKAHRVANSPDKFHVYAPFELDASSSTTSEALTEPKSHHTAKVGQ